MNVKIVIDKIENEYSNNRYIPTVETEFYIDEVHYIARAAVCSERLGFEDIVFSVQEIYKETEAECYLLTLSEVEEFIKDNIEALKNNLLVEVCNKGKVKVNKICEQLFNLKSQIELLEGDRNYYESIVRCLEDSRR